MQAEFFFYGNVLLPTLLLHHVLFLETLTFVACTNNRSLHRFAVTGHPDAD